MRSAIHALGAIVLLAHVCPAGAVVLLLDDFDSEHGGFASNDSLNYVNFANWNVIEGTVDVIGVGFEDFLPGNGLYVDMDGSTLGLPAGTLESKDTFALVPGSYELKFDIAGSQRGTTESMAVSLGSVYAEQFTLASDSPFTTIVRPITVSAFTNAKLVFDHFDPADKIGMLLDDVQLTFIPEPSTLAALDIKPGSDPNSINLGSRGVLPVALLTTEDFDALTVDVETILFGDPLLLNDGGMGVAPLRSGEEDVNDDGLIDLTLKFSMSDLVAYGALGDMSMEAILTGLTFDGMMFESSDSVRLVPPGDANNDLVVDTADYTIWANGFGANGAKLSDGDFNEDRHVDVADYTMWANNVGTDLSAPGSAAAAVPEPSTFALAGLGLVSLLVYGRRRRRGE